MKQRLLALILSLSLLIGLMPVTAMAVGEGAGTGSTVADTSTLTSWKSVFGTNGDLSTKDIGRIWTDKTVSTNDVTLTGDIDNGNSNSVTITKETDADFLVGLSALGSAAKITGETSIPTDTMIVLDVSPKMEDSVDAMLKAANAALKSLLESNSNNRVGVVTYDNTAAVILPLGTYLNYRGGRNEPILSLSGREITATGMTGTGTVGGSFSFDNGAYRNYQFGMYFAMQELYEAENKKVEINGVQVSRTPVVIALASGEPEVGSSTFISVNEDQGNRDIGPETALYNKASAHIAQTFAALLTAGYWKDQVTQAYYSGDGDKAARVYTVAVGDLTYNSDESLAEAALNPVALTESSKVGSEDTNLYDALADYNNGRVTLRRAEGRYGVSTEDVTISKANNNNVTVTWEQIQYNDAFFQAEDMNSEADWTNLFEQILSEVTTQLPTAPTETEEGAAGTGGESGKLIFTDELGRFMEVTGTPTLVFAGTEHEAISSTTSGNTTTYIFEGEVTGNPVYGDADLSEIVLKVTTENNQQTLTWEIPASLLPLRTVDVTGTSNGGGTTYTIKEAENGNAYPIRLFYSVAKDEDAAYSEEDNEYFAQKSKDGWTNYYSNEWTGKEYGDTTAVFTPAATNAFYHYTEDTLLYQLVNRNSYLSETKAEEEKATFIEPGQKSVTVNGIVYTLEPASQYVEGRAYYYAHTYYQATGSGGAAQVYTDYHMIEDGSRLPGVTEQANGHLYITQGTNKLSRVSDADSEKSDDINNSTDTATQIRHPEYSLTEGAKVTIYLGNNGKLTEATPTGNLTVEVKETTGQDADPDQEFTYKLDLYNSQENGYAPLNGTYTLTVYNEDGQSAGTTPIINGNTFKLKAGQKAVVSGLPAGSVFRVTQESEAGYTPAYTSLDHNNEYPSGGGIRWRNDGKQTPYGQITVVNTYDVTQNTFTLTYNANAQGGRVDDLPDGQTASGGEVKLSETVPKHTAVSGKAVLFLGWSETQTNQIYGKDDKAAYDQIKNSVYDAGDQFHLEKNTNLYAVWGYDENDDGNPDVTEQLYTLTYDANGGYFDNVGTTTKEITVLAQKNYELLKSGDQGLPSHVQAEWDGEVTNVVFMGWSTTPDKKIYSVNDTYPEESIVDQIDIAGDSKVYAVWGFDGDGDGTPDINNKTHKITVTTGEGGSADVEYSYNKTQTGTLADSTTNTYYVVDGENLTVKITANSGMAVDTITVDNGEPYVNNGQNTLPDGNNWTSYTFSNVAANHTIAITFAEDADGDGVPDKYQGEYTVTAQSKDGNGSITPPVSIVSTGEDVEFTITAAEKFALDYVTVNGDVVYANNDASNKFAGTWTLKDVREDCTVEAFFGADNDKDGIPDNPSYYTMTISAGTGGSIAPSGTVFVKSGEGLSLTITPNTDYHISDVVVDGSSVGAVGSYTLSNVQGNHTIAAYFAKDSSDPGTRDDYTLHYVTNGGNHLSSETKSSAWTKDYEDLPTPVRDGYTFEGWYWDLRLTEPVTGDVKVDKTTVTLYAKWSEKLGPDDTGVSGWLETDEHNAFLSGYPDGSFQADKNMTRAEVAQMFYALLLDKNVTITKTFSDVEDDAWYAKAVNTMASLGMLEGYPDSTFRPDAPITRAEFAAIALAFAYDPASASCSYTDVSTSAWYYTYVAQATTYGWIGGYPDGSFRPNNSITRAEVAVIVNNMLGRDADESYIDRNADELVSFVDLSKTHWAYYTIMEATNSHDYTSASSGETWTRVK